MAAESISFTDLIGGLQPFRWPLVAAMVALPAVSYGGGRFLVKRSRRAANRFLAAPVYLAVLPGICMALVVGYLLLFTRSNLLEEVDVFIVFGPIACMGATLVAISKVTTFDEIPGFGRLSGLMLASGIVFGVGLFLVKTRIWIFFGGSFKTLLWIFVGAAALFYYALAKIRGRPRG